MLKHLKYLIFIVAIQQFLQERVYAQVPQYDHTREGYLVFHPVKTDRSGKLLSWAANTPAKAFDSVIRATWRFWKNMRTDFNGLPYYMNHQVWRPINDQRGVGGDQFAMALSSLGMLYDYTGDEAVRQNMIFIADYYLSHSLSGAIAAWPNIPFPYNTMLYAGYYDGDMILGRDFTQPDKAGSFGYELVKLYKRTHNEQYLQHAILIANTLATHTKAGSDSVSPLPFKVNAFTGQIGLLKPNNAQQVKSYQSTYTTNFSGTLNLFMELNLLDSGDTATYRKASTSIVAWLKQYPLKTNKWGPFFEDIPGWSDTQINAVTLSVFMMRHPDLFPHWRKDVRKVLDWVYIKLGNNTWEKYGVKAINEQTAYQVPGNSHTARQAAAELEYAVRSGDTSFKQTAIRQLIWSTYMVDTDGKNCYPRDEIWMTDGYGDYIRHYLNAIAFDPALALDNENHLLRSGSVIAKIEYEKQLPQNDLDRGIILRYETYDKSSTDYIKLRKKPQKILGDNMQIPENGSGSNNWHWTVVSSSSDGVVVINHSAAKKISIFK